MSENTSFPLAVKGAARLLQWRQRAVKGITSWEAHEDYPAGGTVNASNNNKGNKQNKRHGHMPKQLPRQR